ncbi:sensor histidine kinase [uncultured Jatrophihabitans sp.]|uniref:sensor histidine kinase n=1 Tax=uncultured Jatrophihabitans sp. TaxID=1610747 RepID=UPI0035CBAE01
MSRSASTAPGFDVAGAAVLCGLGVFEVWGSWGLAGIGTPNGSASRVLLTALVVTATAPLGVRRTHPLTAHVIIAASLVVQVVAVTPSVSLLAGLVPLLIVTCGTAAYGAGVQRFVGLAVSLGAQAAFSVVISEERVHSEMLFGVLVIAGSWTLGIALRRRLRTVDGALVNAHRRAAEQQELATRMLADERARIARELHDVIAHGVSVMGVQSAAARLVLDRDPQSAKETLRAVEVQARESIEELRRLLSVLRARDTPSDLQPQPGLGDLPRLVTTMRSAGLRVDLVAEGTGTRLPTGIDLTAYRIVQEALTNTLKHAGPVSVTVDICQAAAELRIRVADHGPPVARDLCAGHGLTGMRERAALYGGTVHLAMPAGGGLTVEACLPLAVGAP